MFLRRALLRVGLTGKLLIHVGLILALSFLVLIGVAWLRASAVIRDELRKIQIVRIDRWASANLAFIQAGDHWKLAESLESLSHDPYVVYAGLFDKGGHPIAQSGDAEAHVAPHSLDMLVALRSGTGGSTSVVVPGDTGPPLPGLVSDPREAARAVPFSERFKEVLADAGRRSEDLLGWVEVTIDTTPLDALLAGVLAQLAALAAVLLVVALLSTWLLASAETEPLRLLASSAAKIGDGMLDETFDQVPRPADEVGELATQFSIMAARLGKDREKAVRVVQDLKTALDEIRALAGRLRRGEGADAAGRDRLLLEIQEHGGRVERLLDDLIRPFGDQ